MLRRLAPIAALALALSSVPAAGAAVAAGDAAPAATVAVKNPGKGKGTNDGGLQGPQHPTNPLERCGHCWPMA